MGLKLKLPTRISGIVTVLAIAVVLAVGGKAALIYADSGSIVSGVLKVNSTPIAGATVTVDGLSGTTDSAGNYTISAVPNGSYPVTLKYSGLTLTGIPNALDATSHGTNANVNVSGDTTHNLSFATLEQVVTIEDFHGNPASGATVAITAGPDYGDNSGFQFSDGVDSNQYSTSQSSTGITTDANGQATVPVFLNEDYRICATLSYGSSCQELLGSNNSTVTVEVPSPGAISGTFTMNSTPISGVTVLIDNLSTTTNANGNYTINSVPAGSYPVSVHYPSTTASGVPSIFSAFTSSPYVTVDGPVTQNIAIDTGQQAIAVVDTNGNPVPASKVSVGLTSSGVFNDGTDGARYNLGQFVSNGVSDNNGNASLAAIAGQSYNVCATTANNGSESACQSVSADNLSSTITITVPAPGTVSGIYTVNNKPIPHATISIGNLTATTDATGAYAVNNVPAGSYQVSAFYPSTTVTGVPSDLQASSVLPYVQVDGNVTRNIALVSGSQTVSVVDMNGNPVNNAPVSFGLTDRDTATDGTDGTQFFIGQLVSNALTDANGNAALPAFVGSDANVCATTASGSGFCQRVTGDNLSSTIVLTFPAQKPAIPTGLTAPSPTATAPVLTWNPAEGAASYNIYRNSVKIGSTTASTFTDSTVPASAHSEIYTVSAVNSIGESNQSSSVTVVINTPPPGIAYTVAPVADSNGYNTGNVLVTFTCTDNSGSGIASCTSPVNVSNEGIGQTVTGIATDNDGNTTTIHANASLLNQSVNAGGNASGSYAADNDSIGGSTYTSSGSVDTSNVTNPAPQDVYQSSRYGNSFSYTLPNLTPNASYTLMLHFNELYWGVGNSGGGIGSRVFNVAVNGSAALSNYDIYKTAGGANRAITEEIPVTADANGNVVVQFTAVTDNAIVSGLQLFDGALPPQTPHQTYVFSSLINAGGDVTGNFAADSDFSGGTPYATSTAVDTSSIVNPAPESVFQSARYGTNFSYTIPGLIPNTAYNVRLDFNEPYWGVGNSGGVGSRVFNVGINGTNELTNFDIFATAGGANKAVAKDFTVTSDAQGKITVQFTTVTDNAIVSGIEVTQP